MSELGLEHPQKIRQDQFNNFMLPGPAKSVPGPLLMNGDETL